MTEIAWKRLQLVFILLSAVMLLCGCKKIQESVMQSAGMYDDGDYLKYNDYENKVHVTLGRDSRLNISYYLDADCTELIQGNDVYLEPGNAVYYSNNHGRTDNVEYYYDVERFEIKSYDNTNPAGLSVAENGVVLNIPKGFEGKELSVLPYAKQVVRVFLPQPEFGGRIEYAVDGNPLDIDDADGLFLDAGTRITMKFIPYNGIVSNAQDGTSYIVESGGAQTVKAGDMDVDSVFQENESMRLKVEKGKNALKDVEFSIFSGDENIKTVKTDKAVVCDEKSISGLKPITIWVNNLPYNNGKALRYEVARKDEDNNVRIYYDYKDNPSANSEVIHFYDSEEDKANAPLAKETIVKISYVDLIKHDPIVIDNGSVDVLPCDDTVNAALQYGDPIDQNRKIKIVLKADDGWYVKGANNGNETFESKEMSYEDYLKNKKTGIDAILQAHPIEKLISITLADAERYGQCVYKLNGKEVGGTIEAKLGDQLTIKYEITDKEHYKLVGGSLFDKGNEKKIAIDDSYDRQTIIPEDYISVVKKGIN